MKRRVNWLWTSAVVALVIVSVLGAALAWSRYDRGSPVELSLDRRPPAAGTIYLGDGVINPGVYAYTADDTIGDLLHAAGGAREDADLSSLRLSLASGGEAGEPQRVDINRAGIWLLEALPGIGNTLAQRILDYRSQNGPFKNTAELAGVSGIGKDTYNKIRDLITVDGD
jgi:competence protein ComEA